MTEKLDVLVKKYPSRKSVVILFTNRTDDTITATYMLKRLAGIPEGTCFNWSEESSVTLGKKYDITLTLTPRKQTQLRGLRR